MTKKINNSESGIVWFCDALSIWSLRAIVFAVPLIFSPWLAIYYELPKLLVLRTLIISLVILAILKIVATGKIVFKKTSLDLPLLTFLFILVLSTIFSIDPTRSILGEFHRYEGLLTMTCYVLLVWLSVNSIKSEENLNRVLDASIFGAFFVSLIGILQHYGLNLLELPAHVGQTASTIGNSAFLSSYLALTFFVALARSFTAPIRMKIFSAITSVLAFTCLILTYSRSGWVGFAVGVLFLAALGVSQRKKIKINNLKKPIQLLGIAIITTLLILVALSSYAPLKKTEGPSELETLKERTISAVRGGGTVATRFILWKSTLRATADRPLLGYGRDTLALVLPKYLPEEIHEIEKNTYYDKAHNELLETLITTGILGLIAFLWIIIALYRNSLKTLGSIKKTDLALTLGGLLAGITACLVQLQFNPASVNFDYLLWIMMGLALSIGQLTTPKEKEIELPWVERGTPHYLAVFAISGLLIFTLYKTTIEPIRADFCFKEGFRAEFYEMSTEAINLFEKAADEKVGSEMYLLKLGDIYKAKMESTTSKEYREYFDKAIKAYEEARDLNPYSINPYISLGVIYGNYNQPEKAAENFKKAIEIDPYMEGSHLGLGFAYFKMGKTNESIPELERAIELNPKCNKNAYNFLGRAYGVKKDWKNALEIVNKGLEIWPGDKELKLTLNEISEAKSKN